MTPESQLVIGSLLKDAMLSLKVEMLPPSTCLVSVKPSFRTLVLMHRVQNLSRAKASAPGPNTWRVCTMLSGN